MKELTINLEIHGEQPLYEQIYTYIKKAIQKGAIAFGEKLPSTRALAKHLQISRTTVDLAYDQLLSEGYIEAKPYKGYFVSQIEELYQIETKVRGREQPQKSAVKTYVCDFSLNGIDLDHFPYGVWRRITKSTLNDDRKELFQLGDPMGEWALRTTISHYLYESRGVNCSPDQMIIGAGNDYLLMLLSRIIGESHRIAMENPTYRQAYKTFACLGYALEAIGMDQAGMKVEELLKTEADIAYVMPSRQFPMGYVMPIKRRLELLRWANEKPGRYIIEDDYDSEFRYKGKPVPSLWADDRSQKVIYLGTFSKSIAPAIRISYMVLPETLLKEYQKKCTFFSSTVSRIDQTIVNEFILQGYYERHLNKMRTIYKSKHDILLNELKTMNGICKIYGENAGLHILLEFTNGLSEKEAVERAGKEKIKVYGLSEMNVGKENMDNSRTVLMGYANLKEKEIIESVSGLKRCWSAENS